MSDPRPASDDLTSASLPVAETFYSIQGEGPHAGTPAVFLRTGGCNLLCGAPPDPDRSQDELEPNAEAGATWVCDTIETWRSADEWTIDDLLTHWEARGWLDRLRSGGAHLVITGGEPMLHQLSLMALLRDADVLTTEIETNGTIDRTAGPLDSWIDRYNVSLKLSNSGMSEAKRIRSEAVRSYTGEERVSWKFVLAGHDDPGLAEIDALIDRFSINPERVQLMPAGATREQLRAAAPEVAAICKERGWRFSPRLQVNLWDQAVGV